ncbi:RDD family protein [Paraburkholderia sp. MM5477-R1]|uniref:RDD family protein n=1 Tax=Paraburkholderia sp. MM5477-R1 TaxID=2991062 RepID=UPI003D24AD7E
MPCSLIRFGGPSLCSLCLSDRQLKTCCWRLAPGAFASTLVLWLLVGQCVPILVTGILWAVWGTSPGKRVLRLRIVDADTGQPMTVRQAFLRTAGYMLTFATCGAGFLWVPFNRKRSIFDVYRLAA